MSTVSAKHGLVIGQRVEVDLWRALVRKPMPSGDVRNGERRAWVPSDYRWGTRPSWMVPRVVEGVVVGIRSIADGRTRWGFDEPTGWITESTQSVVLVAYDLYRKPERFLPGDVKTWRGGAA